MSDHELINNLIFDAANGSYYRREAKHRIAMAGAIRSILSRTDAERPMEDFAFDPLTRMDDRPDTSLTRLVLEAWRMGYRGEGTANPGKTVDYMMKQLYRNEDESDFADFTPKVGFWEMFKDRYAQWRIERIRKGVK
jgi:hypothetical protein